MKSLFQSMCVCVCTCTLSVIIRSYIYHLLTFSAEDKIFSDFFPMNSMVSSRVLCIYCLDARNIIADSIRSMFNLSKMMNKVDLLLYGDDLSILRTKMLDFLFFLPFSDQIYSSTTTSMG